LKVNNHKPIACGSVTSPIGAVFAAVAGKNVIYLSITCRSKKNFLAELSEAGRTTNGFTVTFSDDSVQGLLHEVSEYFEGARKRFTYSAEIAGYTPFQQKVLQAASTIPYGETRSYRWLAEQAGSPNAARAAGQVMAKNPVPLIIPCHRVIGSGGGLCGFAGGLRALDLKKRLLDLEAGRPG